MKRYILFICLSLFILLLWFNSLSKYSHKAQYFAKANPSSKTHANSTFVVSHDVPNGFQQLDQQYETLIDVYYQGELIGSFKALISPGEIQFKQPAAILKQISGVVNEVKLQRALSKKISSHTNLVYDVTNHKEHRALNPKTVGVIYNPDIFRADLFISPAYLKNKNHMPEMLPSSTSGLSYTNKIFSAASNTYEYNAGEYHSYNFTTDNTWAYKNGRANLLAAYASNIFGKNNAEISQANIEVNRKQYIYSFGLLDTAGNVFFANQKILGAEVATTLNTIPVAKRGIGNPVYIFLNFPGQINVYKDGKLIYTARYPAGRQQLDTSAFPSGAYPIIIKITDIQGVTSEQTQFFVKTNQLAPFSMPQYYVAAGCLMGQRIYNSALFTKLYNIPVYQAGMNYRMSQQWGTDAGILGNDKDAFAKLGLIYMQHYWQVQPAILFGTSKNYGCSGRVEFNVNPISIYFNVTKMLSRNYKPIINPERRDDYYYTFINNNDLQINSNINYFFNHSSLSFYVSKYKNRSQPNEYSYGPSFTTQLFTVNHTPVNLAINYNKSRTNYQIAAMLSVNFNTNHNIYGSGSVGYTKVKNYLDNRQTGNGLNANGSVNWNHVDQTRTGYNVGINAHATPVADSVGATYNYDNNRMHLETYANYNHNKNITTFNQYGGVFSTVLGVVPHAATIGNGNLQSNTGIIAKVKNPNKFTTYDIYANNRVVKHIYANESIFVSLAPFRTYQIHVKNTSRQLFCFKRQYRQITLYPGNIQYLVWKAVQKYVIAGRLVDRNHHPIKNALIKGGIGLNMSDNNGYFQVEVISDTRRLIARGDHLYYFNVPKIAAGKIFVYTGDVICFPQK